MPWEPGRHSLGVCVGVVSPVPWEHIFDHEKEELASFSPGTGYPETKLHSFLEDSPQGLNKQLPLA